MYKRCPHCGETLTGINISSVKELSEFTLCPVCKFQVKHEFVEKPYHQLNRINQFNILLSCILYIGFWESNVLSNLKDLIGYQSSDYTTEENRVAAIAAYRDYFKKSINFIVESEKPVKQLALKLLDDCKADEEFVNNFKSELERIEAVDSISLSGGDEIKYLENEIRVVNSVSWGAITNKYGESSGVVRRRLTEVLNIRIKRLEEKRLAEAAAAAKSQPEPETKRNKPFKISGLRYLLIIVVIVTIKFLHSGTTTRSYYKKPDPPARPTVDISRVLAIYQNPKPYKSERSKWGYKDANGKTVIKPQFQEAREFSMYGRAPVKKEGKWGFVDKNGKIVVPPVYDTVGVYTGGLTLATKGTKIYYLDSKGNTRSGSSSRPDIKKVSAK